MASRYTVDDVLDLLDDEEIVVEDAQGFEEYCFQGSDDELPDIAR